MLRRSQRWGPVKSDTSSSTTNTNSNGEKIKKKTWRVLKSPRKSQLLEAKDRFGNWTSAVIVNTKEISGELNVLVFL